MYSHTYNQTENTNVSQKTMSQHLLVEYIIHSLIGQSFWDEFFWWNVLDIARTSFKGIQNFKFQLFQNSTYPNTHDHSTSLIGQMINVDWLLKTSM